MLVLSDKNTSLMHLHCIFPCTCTYYLTHSITGCTYTYSCKHEHAKTWVQVSHVIKHLKFSRAVLPNYNIHVVVLNLVPRVLSYSAPHGEREGDPGLVWSCVYTVDDKTKFLGGVSSIERYVALWF